MGGPHEGALGGRMGRGGEGATRTVVRRSLSALASRVADKPLGLVGFSSCGAQAQ